MKKFYIFAFLFLGCLFFANAQDLIIMTDGNVTEAIVIERTETEVRYRRYDNLTGPIHVLPLSFVLTIRYENGSVWLAAPVQGQEQPVTQLVSDTSQVTTISQALILILNQLPAVRVAGNNLKFIFTADSWTATVNGENFSQGTIEYEGTDEGGTLTLKQTHIYPGAAAATAGRIASRIPGAGAVGGHLQTAGQLAGGLVGAVEMSGPEIVLEYRAGPPPSLSLLAYRGGEREARRGRRGSGDGNTQEGALDNQSDFEGIGLAVALDLEFARSDIWAEYTHFYPHIIFERSFMDNSFDLYTELGYNIFIDDYEYYDVYDNFLFFKLKLGYNFFINPISTLSLYLGNEFNTLNSYNSFSYNSKNYFNPGIKHTWSLDFGSIYADMNFNFPYGGETIFNNDKIIFQGKLGYDTNFGLGFWIRQDFWLNHPGKWKQFNFLVSFERGFFYAEVENGFFSNNINGYYYLIIRPKIQFTFANRFKLWGAFTIEKPKDFDSLFIPGIGISYSY